ncbi:gp41 [Alphaproteobacteria phage PhiJL001]|uniref:Gp41 n=1 Tax=Alphaproteobacteria phage PhiJL001 TaxID=2681607 RepID=Q5DN64_9CAUD|nr:gp41 [Alphaproteobacteria phage PhiJL001]AAT69517.1 gp41 [Alphaproteobacteria phage PhiJL001]
MTDTPTLPDPFQAWVTPSETRDFMPQLNDGARPFWVYVREENYVMCSVVVWATSPSEARTIVANGCQHVRECSREYEEHAGKKSYNRTEKAKRLQYMLSYDHAGVHVQEVLPGTSLNVSWAHNDTVF